MVQPSNEASGNAALSGPIGVIGAGQMGAGIAHVCAQAGYQTLLWDSNSDALEKGFAGIGSRLESALQKGRITPDDAQGTRSRLKKSGAIEEFAPCALVIEAIIENFEIKAELFRRLNPILSGSAVLATNTSSISITKLASVFKNPAQFIGMHFMNPVPVMKLVEVIRGLQSADTTYNLSVRVVERLGKIAVLGIDSPGFVVNRILCPMINEAIFLLQEGVQKEAIDNGMKLGTNQPMGPLELADFVGLDTLFYILQILHKELGEDKYRPCPLLTKYVEAGWFGRKTGRGFYQYQNA